MIRVNWYFSYRSMLVSVRLLAGLASVNFLAARRRSFLRLRPSIQQEKDTGNIWANIFAVLAVTITLACTKR
jgi:hypothetical protein